MTSVTVFNGFTQAVIILGSDLIHANFYRVQIDLI